MNRPVWLAALLCGTAAAAQDDDAFKWVTKPGKGIQMAQIDSIYYDGYLTPTPTGTAFREDTLLLLRDGTVYSGLQVSPADLDVAASRKNEPDEWGKWKKQGQKVLVQDPDTGKWDEISGFKVVPATPNERVGITVEAANAVNFGSFGGFSTFDTLTFNKDGTFERSGVTVGGSGAAQAAGGVLVGSTSTSGKDGCSSATSTSSSAGAGGGGSTTNCGKDNQGKYTLNGYTAEFRSASGKTQRVLFFFWDKKKKDLFIGDTTFSKEE